MTHFIARFPQHSKPIQNPKPHDYFEAAGCYRLQNPELSEKFYRVYRRLKWAYETTRNRIKGEHAS